MLKGPLEYIKRPLTMARRGTANINAGSYESTWNQWNYNLIKLFKTYFFITQSNNYYPNTYKGLLK